MTRQEIEMQIKTAGLDPTEVLTHERAAELIGCDTAEVHAMLDTGEVPSLSRLDVAEAQAAFPPSRGVLHMGSEINRPIVSNGGNR